MDNTTATEIIVCDSCGADYPEAESESNECANSERYCPDCRRVHLLFCGVCT